MSAVSGSKRIPAGLNQREANKRLDAIMPESEWEGIAPEDYMQYLISRLFGPIRVPPQHQPSCADHTNRAGRPTRLLYLSSS